MKEFEYNDITVKFWKEGSIVFCKVEEMGADLYCCGERELPETVEEAVKMTETAWAW